MPCSRQATATAAEPTYTYTVRIEPAGEDGFNVLVPALPGCVT